MSGRLGRWQQHDRVLTRDLGHGQAVERVTRTASAVTWDVLLNAPTHAAVTVSSAVRGPGRGRMMSHGVVWDLPDGGRLRMSRMVAVDATGRRLYAALPRLGGSRLSMHVPAAALRGAAFPVTLDPTISVEYPSATPTLEAADPAGADIPDVTWDSATSAYSVLWRSGSADSSIRLARVTQAGAVSDVPGLDITDSSHRADNGAAIASDGTTRLVTWSSVQLGAPLWARTISAAGSLGPFVAIASSTSGVSRSEAAVASDGNGFEVVWQEQVGSTVQIRAAHVAADGTVDVPGGTVLSPSASGQFTPAVTAEASGYLVTWTEGQYGSRQIKAVRMTTAGAVSGTVLSVSPGGSDATFSDVSFLAATATDVVVWFAAGTVQLATVTGTAVSSPATVATVSASEPQVASSSQGSLVTWGDLDTSTHYSRRVASDGTMGSPVALGTGAWGALASDGTDFLSSWGYNAKTYGRLVDGATGDAQGSEPFLVAKGPDPQRDPDIAWNGTTHLVVWQDRRTPNDDWDIYAARVDANGAMQDGTGIAIATSTGDETEPSVSSVGTDFLVAWHTHSGSNDTIEERTVSSTGSLGDVSTLTSSGSARSPSVAHNSTGYLVAWVVNNNTVDTAVVSSAGAASATQVTVPAGNNGFESIAWQAVDVASDGTNYMLFLSRVNTTYFNGSQFWYVDRATVSATGASLTTNYQTATTSANPSISISYGAGTYVVAWTNGTSVFAEPVTGTTAGTPLTVENDQASDAGSVRDVTITADNNTFLATWIRGVSDAPVLRAARLSPTQLYDQTPFAVASGDSLDNVASTNIGGKYALAYQRQDAELGVPRVYVRIVDNASTGDQFATPQVITGSSGSATGDTLLATKENLEPDHAGNAGGASIWYSWTAPTTGAVELDAADSTFDTLLGVYVGNSVGSLTEIASNDNVSSNGRSGLVFGATAGTTYRIAVDGASGARGAVGLAWGPVASNDDFVAATPIATSSGSAVVRTVGTTKETGEPNHAGDAGGHSVWWSFTAPAEGLYTFSTEGSSFSTLLAAYTGSAVDGLTQVTSSSYSPGLPPGAARIYLRLDQGAHVAVVVDGASAASGRANLAWIFAPAPPNDDFAAAAPLTTGGFPGVPGTNVAASSEPGEPDALGASVWYTLTPTLSGTLHLTLDSSNVRTSVYTGSSLSALTRTALTYGTSQLSTPVVAGTTYHISVDSLSGYDPGQTGSFHYQYFFQDTAAPNVSIDSHPDALTNQSDVSFAFSADEPATFYCQLDTGNVEVCTSPKSYPNVSDGDHTFTVYAKDPSNNTSSSQQAPFTVDTVGPDTNISSGPTGTTTSTTADFSFEASEQPVTFECALDAGPFSDCTSPLQLSGLSSGLHELQVRAIDAAGNPDPFPASRSWTVDADAPVPVLKPLATFTSSKSVPVAWGVASGSEAAASYDVRYAVASYTTSTLSGTTIWKSQTTSTSGTFAGRPGRTYCFQVRARDALGNTSGWTAQRCTAVPVDDAALSGSGWTKLTGSGYYLGTARRSTHYGDSLRLTGVHTRQVSLVATRCPGCGKVKVFLGKTLLKTIDLAAAAVHRRSVIAVAKWAGVHSGTVRIVVATRSKPVTIEGLGLRLV